MVNDLRRFQAITGDLPHFTSKFATANKDSNTWFGLLSASANSFLEVTDKRTGKSMFEEYLKNCHQFIFFPEGDSSGSWDTAWSESEELALDLPYPVMSIELTHGSITVPLPTDPVQIYIKMILVREISPKEYDFICLSKVDGKQTVTTICDSSTKEWAALNGLLKHYLKRISKEKLGVESKGSKVKVGSGKNKFFWKPHGITHVSGIKYIGHVTPTMPGRTINWESRWEVRGHWRVTKGVGKDRAGNYNVVGHTWVSNHVKGPENAPIVKKTYVVDA